VKNEIIIDAIEQINKGDVACIVIEGDTITYKEKGRGVKPILTLCKRGVLNNVCVVDKVVGKAAAMVMTYAGVKMCYAITISKHALKWFEDYGVIVKYDNLVEYIVNRRGDGMCPMECATKELEDDRDIVYVLQSKLKELSYYSNN